MQRLHDYMDHLANRIRAWTCPLSVVDVGSALVGCSRLLNVYIGPHGRTYVGCFRSCIVKFVW